MKNNTEDYFDEEGNYIDDINQNNNKYNSNDEENDN